MQQNQKGFGVIETIIIIAVVGLIAGLGWYVFGKNKESDKSSTLTAQDSQSTKKQSNNIDSETVKEKVVKNGNIIGKLSYASGGKPPLNVCAYNVTDDKDETCVTTATNQSTYSISVKPGDYYVYASVKDGQGALATYKAYYNEFSKCGNSVECSEASHKQYIKVAVASGSTVGDVNPSDWYAQ